MSVLDTSSIILETFDSNDSFAFGQPRCGERRIWKNPPQTDPEENSEDAKDNEHPLVWEHSINLLLAEVVSVRYTFI